MSALRSANDGDVQQFDRYTPSTDDRRTTAATRATTVIR
ncbi:hypothetical protein HALLA_07280 [Halostagnicola larsenii XH-48]|uniref:Uncharacterized protein n=1 Tax=Halostagnicola larsenii XH-48 TaxID=797299 RepID=W0JQC5_9EURY|nr:hypothetical protein HALLA_07280 [Halostagnicola larsenii XH-48]